MLHFSRWKIIAIIATVLAGLIFSLPNFLAKETMASWPSFIPKKQLPLGLDLRGGAHLLLAMDPEEIKKDWLSNLRDAARKTLRDTKIGYSGLGVQGPALQIKLSKPEDKDTALKELRKLIQPIGNAILGTGSNDIDVSEGTDAGTILIKPTDQGIRDRISQASASSIETINRRVNALGTAESTVVRQGVNRILIQFPGLGAGRVKTPEEIKIYDPCAVVKKSDGDAKGSGLGSIDDLKALIGCTAKLTFHEVHPSASAEDAKLTSAPAGFKVFPGDASEGGDYLLRDSPVVQGEDLADAQAGFDSQNGQPVINFRFNQSGARKFGAFTKDNVGRPFAIVLDGKVLSAPVIREAILSGSGQISGSYTVESASTLAVQLKSGALPTKLTIVEERTVGPSLGADSIDAGRRAGMIGLAATAILTILAYGTFGVYAVIGLLVHGLLILALMTAIGTTLTLPGIAGFVLTIGMAVDANVLIYERIREELRAGKGTIAAIDAGFTRAFVTIADSQLTTLAAAVIMFWLGSGPIRGFAVTLSLGIITSIFAAVTITRLLVSLWLKNAKGNSKNLEVPI